jgi:nucleoside-diphosphate-sugar epimerase
MAGSLFITGASGFIGRCLLARLDTRHYENVYCLTRSEAITRQPTRHKNLRWLVGSIFDSGAYGGCLDASDVVIHLAAVTGRASRDEYFMINSAGTRHLLAECRQRGVRKFLYVSSIAVKYTDKSNYDYARSKQAGEEAVVQSNLAWTIVRPTIVLGTDSPAWKSLSKLARLPVLVVLGTGATRIQPIDVEDLVDALISLVEHEGFSHERLDLGGRDVISIEEFLRRLHWLYYTKEAKVVHVPPQPVTRAIGFAERFVPSLLPFNAGQLCVFSEDGTAELNRLHAERAPRMKDLGSLLNTLMVHERSRQ